MAELTPDEIEWLTVLETGRFPDGTPARQGHRYLNVEGRMCCIGVRCELDARNGRTMLRLQQGAFTTYKDISAGYVDAFAVTTAPAIITNKRWGWDTTQGHTPIMEQLISWNDSDGLEFPAIAQAYREWKAAQ